MAKAKDEDDKKHGDKFESLIDRAGGRSSPKTDDDPAPVDDDDDEDLESDDGEDRREI